MKGTTLGIIFILFLLSGCIVQSPRYTHIENVLQLHQGMTESEVKTTLGVGPYDLKSVKDSATRVLIYKYRVTDRKTIPLFQKATNGVSATGKYSDLFITYSASGTATRIESCSKCEETKEKTTKVNVSQLLTLLTVTVPALLVYLGLK